MINLPTYTIVFCDWTGAVEPARDGFCFRCGSTEHREAELSDYPGDYGE